MLICIDDIDFTIAACASYRYLNCCLSQVSRRIAKGESSSLRSIVEGFIRVCLSFQDKYPIIPAAMALSISPLLQGAPLVALQDFFVVITHAGEPSLQFSALLPVSKYKIMFCTSCCVDVFYSH
jgi:hypothetical protein